MKDSKIVQYMEIPLDIKTSESRKICFIVYSTRESHIDITLDAIETVLDSTKKYDIKKLSIHGIPGHSQYTQLLDYLNKCSLAVIVLDGFRPNVIFEYGVLVGLRKPCIVLLEENATIDIKSFMKNVSKKIPIAVVDMDKDFSDVKDQMYVKYRYNDPKIFRELLRNELKKIEPLVDDAFMKLIFPEKDYIEKEVKDSMVVLSGFIDIDRKLTADDEVRFRVCVAEIEKTAKKYGIKLTLSYYYHKIEILLNLKKYEEVLKLIGELLTVYSSNIILLLFKSDVLTAQGKYESSLMCLNDAIQIDGDIETLWHKKALLLERQEKKDEAEICYKKGIAIKHSCSEIHYNYGIFLFDKNQYDEALNQFIKAIKLRSRESKYFVWKAICLRKLDQVDAAKKAIREALSFNENNVNAWYQLGVLEDNDAKAVEHFDKCLSLDSKHCGALCSRASLLTAMGRAEDALIDLQQASKLCDDFAHGRCNQIYGTFGKAKYSLYKTGKYEYKDILPEALDYFTKALSVPLVYNEEKQQAYNNIGYIYLSLSNILEAKLYLTKAHEIKTVNKKDEAIAAYNLSLCYLLERDYTKTRELLTSTITIMRKIKTPERQFMVLLIPAVSQTNINLVELNKRPDLLECAETALRITDSINRT